jgi:hypothetical protein
MVLIDGRTTMLRYNMGRELDTAAILGLMRFLRTAKEESKQFEQ